MKRLHRAIAKYNTAVSKNISESEVLWSRYSAILVFNTILITAIGLSYQQNVNLPFIIRLFLSLSGLITCFLWWFMTYQGFRWIDRWITSARIIENKYLKENNPKSDPYLNPILKGYKEKGAPPVKIHDVEIGKTEIASYALIVLAIIIYSLFILSTLSMKIYSQQQKRIHTHHGYNDWMVRDRRLPKAGL